MKDGPILSKLYSNCMVSTYNLEHPFCCNIRNREGVYLKSKASQTIFVLPRNREKLGRWKELGDHGGRETTWRIQG